VSTNVRPTVFCGYRTESSNGAEIALVAAHHLDMAEADSDVDVVHRLQQVLEAPQEIHSAAEWVATADALQLAAAATGRYYSTALIEARDDAVVVLPVGRVTVWIKDGASVREQKRPDQLPSPFSARPPLTNAFGWKGLTLPGVLTIPRGPSVSVIVVIGESATSLPLAVEEMPVAPRIPTERGALLLRVGPAEP
jgi:hypothetical protein